LLLNQRLAQMRADKAGAAGNQNAHVFLLNRTEADMIVVHMIPATFPLRQLEVSGETDTDEGTGKTGRRSFQRKAG